MPLNIARVVKDGMHGVRDITRDSKNYQNFVKYGGMMDFLHKQGQFKGTTKINKAIKNNIDNRKREKLNMIGNALTLRKLQMLSEMGLRMGVFNRSVKNQMKELGVENEKELKEKYGNESKQMLEDLYVNATASARNTTDFNQGGFLTKDVDAFVPYLNAGIQGNRVMVEAIENRPIETLIRMSQAAVIKAAFPVAIGIWLLGMNDDDREEDEKDLSGVEMYLKARKGVSRYDRTNYMIVFTGERTEDGEFKYLRIAKSHTLTPLISLAEGVFIDIMKEKTGDVDYKNDYLKEAAFGLENNISPLDFSVQGNLAKNPFLKAGFTYGTGYDFYRNQNLSHLKDKKPVPVEGHESKSVEDFYKKIGLKYNVSPARMKGAVESIFTTPSTTPYMGIAYGGLDAITSDKDSKEVFKSLGKDLLKSSIGRVAKQTSKFNREVDFDKMFEKEFSKIEIENLVNGAIFKKLGKKLGENTNIEEIRTELEKIAKKSPFDVERMTNIMISSFENPDYSPYFFQIKYSQPKQRAIILAELFGSDLMDITKDLKGSNRQLYRELLKANVLKGETIYEYNKLIKSK